MSRQTVVNMVLNAYMLDDCLSAEEALTQWLTAHPQDIGLHELAGQVGIVKAAAMERAATSTKTNTRPTLTASGR